MKKVLFLLLLVLAGTTLAAQTPSYNDLTRQAERLHANDRNYKGALAKYREAFALQAPLAKDLYNSACSATLSGDIDQGFELLKQAVEAGWSDELGMKMDRDLKSLRSKTARWEEVQTLMRQKAEMLKTAQASLKAAGIPADQASQLLVPFFADGYWGAIRRDNRAEVLPAIFELPPFFGEVGVARFRSQWYKMDVTTGAASGYFPPTPALSSSILAPRVVPNAKSPAKGFVVDSTGRLKDRAEQYEAFQLVKCPGANGAPTQYWAVVQLKSTSKWGVVNAAGDPLPGTRLDFASLQSGNIFDPTFTEEVSPEQVLVYQKANGEQGLLDFSGKTHLVKGFDSAAPLRLEMWAKPSARAFLKFKKGDKWGVVGRKPGSTQWVVVLEPRFSDVSGYGYSFTGAFNENDPTSYQASEYFFHVRDGADQYCVDLQGKAYRVKR